MKLVDRNPDEIFLAIQFHDKNFSFPKKLCFNSGKEIYQSILSVIFTANFKYPEVFWNYKLTY